MTLKQKVDAVEKLLTHPAWHRFFTKQYAIPSWGMSSAMVIHCSICGGHYEQNTLRCDAERFPGDSCIKRLEEPCRIPKVEGCYKNWDKDGPAGWSVKPLLGEKR